MANVFDQDLYVSLNISIKGIFDKVCNKVNK